MQAATLPPGPDQGGKYPTGAIFTPKDEDIQSVHSEGSDYESVASGETSSYGGSKHDFSLDGENLSAAEQHALTEINQIAANFTNRGPKFKAASDAHFLASKTTMAKKDLAALWRISTRTEPIAAGASMPEVDTIAQMDLYNIVKSAPMGQRVRACNALWERLINAVGKVPDRGTLTAAMIRQLQSVGAMKVALGTTEAMEGLELSNAYSGCLRSLGLNFTPQTPDDIARLISEGRFPSPEIIKKLMLAGIPPSSAIGKGRALQQVSDEQPPHMALDSIDDLVRTMCFSAWDAGVDADTEMLRSMVGEAYALDSAIRDFRAAYDNMQNVTGSSATQISDPTLPDVIPGETVFHEQPGSSKSGPGPTPIISTQPEQDGVSEPVKTVTPENNPAPTTPSGMEPAGNANPLTATGSISGSSPVGAPVSSSTPIAPLGPSNIAVIGFMDPDPSRFGSSQ